jgi:hypothetical protein
MKTIFTTLLFFISLQLSAQLFIDAEGSAALNQGFASLGFGKRYQNGLSLRGPVSAGNFGWEKKDAYPPYSYYTVDEMEFADVTGFSSSHAGVGAGLGLGYTFQLNDGHGIYVEALGQAYAVTDYLEMHYLYYGGPFKGATWSRKKMQKHMSWSAGIGVGHQIRLNHFLSVYYGIRANYFEKIGPDGDYAPGHSNAMCGLEPTLYAGLKFTLQRKEN